MPHRPPSIASIYTDKPPSYFASSRQDIVELLATGPDSAVLELGCGAGGTGQAVMAAGKAGRYVGIELDGDAAAAASALLTEVLVGDVQELDLAPLRATFDALIISEVLEHLTDPWSTLRTLVECLKPGGAIFASSPNIAHWAVIKELIFGRFEYADVGVMDRTHLRWFTPESYRQMFETAGLDVVSVRPLVPLRWKARILNKLTSGRFHHLFVVQIMVEGRRR